MFSGRRSASPSPCPSPVRDLVANLKFVSSPKRDKYKTMIESQEPMISKGRLTMNGGFADFRPRPINYMEKGDSLESDDGTPSISSSSRSASCDSNDPIVDHPSAGKTNRSYVKIPRKALKNVIHHLSPRLSKKLMNEEKKYEIFAPQNPKWPNVMSTYTRGVSTSSVQSMVTPSEPSLTAMKARALLDDKRQLRDALQILAKEVNQREPLPSNSDSGCSSSSSNSDQEDADDYLDYPNPASHEGSESYEPINEIAENLLQFHLHKSEGVSGTDIFPINPKINIQAPDVPILATSSEDDFQDESIFDALDLDSVPTLSPEELTFKGVTEVRNVHLCREYIILETGPPTESVFV